MFPVFIDFGTHDLPLLGETHLFLPTYGLIFAIAVLLAWVWFTRRARSLGIEDETLFNLTFYSLLAGIIGAKLFLVVIDWRLYLDNPAELLGTLRAAGVLMGGVACGAFTFILYARHRGLPLFRLMDAIVAPLALAQALGRLGCFCAGCCWGLPAASSSRFAVTFSHPMAHRQTGVPTGVPLVPTQLIEMGYDLLLVLLLTLLWRRLVRPEGTLFWLYLLLYSLGRGIIEFWRGDVQRGLYLGDLMSTSQLLSVAGALLALLMLLRSKLRSGACRSS
jgi:phosphatidylglycerol:prolipoprotein diacylglycerol transferase